MLKNQALLRPLLVAALLLVALVGCTAAQAAPPAQSQETLTADVPRTITVVGTGTVSLKPDLARINVGAEATAPTVSEAKAEVDRQIAAILNALKGLDISEKDIQTSHYSVRYERQPYEPVFREGARPESQGAYRVSNMLRVTVREIDAAALVLDAVVEAGANQVYGVSFTVSDNAAWQSMARKEAVADATARAEELAGLAKVNVGQVLSISEVVGGSPVPMLAVERAMGGGGIAPGGFRGFQAGGIVRQPTIGVIGEGGHDEAIIPLQNGAVPVTLTGAGAGDTYINLSFPGFTNSSDLYELKRILPEILQEYTRDGTITGDIEVAA